MIKLDEPTLVVPLNILSEPSGFSRLLSANTISKELVYMFRYLNINTNYREFPLKIGRTAGGKYKGERIYRQIKYIPGWSTVSRSSSGVEILDIIKDFETLYPSKIVTKDTVEVLIWDVSHLAAMNATLRSTMGENMLFQEYKKYYGELPIGNLRGSTIGTNLQIVHTLFI